MFAKRGRKDWKFWGGEKNQSKAKLAKKEPLTEWIDQAGSLASSSLLQKNLLADFYYQRCDFFHKNMFFSSPLLFAQILFFETLVLVWRVGQAYLSTRWVGGWTSTSFFRFSVNPFFEEHPLTSLALKVTSRVVSLDSLSAIYYYDCVGPHEGNVPCPPTHPHNQPTMRIRLESFPFIRASFLL